MPPKCAHPANEFLVMEMEKMIEQEAAKSHRRAGPGQVNHTLSSYQRALHSIRNHTAYIETGEQAKALRGVGNFIAQKINAILIRLEAAATYGEDVARHLPLDDAQPKQKAGSKKRKATPSTTHPDDPPSNGTSKVYKPSKGKLPWYVIMALWAIGATSESRGVELSSLVTEMKELGFDGTTTQLTARLSGLINVQHVVDKTADSGLYYLSLDGIRSATECQRETAPRAGLKATACADEPAPFDWASTNLSTLIPTSSRPAQPHAADDVWEVVLLLDHREMISRTNRSVFERKLLESNVACEVRSLNIGDMIWIARSPTRLNKGKPEEFVLDVVVERKNVSDLASSIIDKRYTEQKARLKESGLRYVIYLVEGSLAGQATCIRGGGLQTAMTRTQVQHNFLVYHGTSHDETVGFLAAVHRHIVHQFHKCFLGCSNPCPTTWLSPAPPRPLHDFTCAMSAWQPHTEFQASSRKKAALTVGEIHQMMLMQVPKLGRATVLHAAKTYPTMSSLWNHVHAGRPLALGSSTRRAAEPSHTFLVDLCTRSSYATTK